MIARKISRRSFVKGAAILAGGLPVLSSVGMPFAADGGKVTNDSYIRGKLTKNWCEMCFWGCGVDVYSEGDRVLRVEGQKNCPYNTGSLCARGNAGVHQLYDPDRLKYPLIREGARGEGRFRKVSWDEATTYIADKLKANIEKYGAKSTALICHGAGQGAFTALMGVIGSENIGVPSFSQCLGGREISWFLTYGMPLTSHECTDGAYSKCMMFIGRNILESLQVGETKRVIDGMAKGAKIIAVDPRYSKTAAKADYWLKIKPGTDLALTLGMIAYIVNNELYDKNYVSKYCERLDELKQYVKNITLDWAAAETDLPKDLIETVTLELVKASPACFVHPGKRVSRYGNDTQYSRSVAILNALLGAWESKGGFFTINSMKVKVPKLFDYTPIDSDEFERIDLIGEKYLLSPTNLGLTNGIIEGIRTQQPYPMKSLFIFGGNIFMNASDDKTTKEAFEQLDLAVTYDIYLTESALYSDVILPEMTYLERQDPISIQSDRYPFAQFREKAVEPMYDTMSAWDAAAMIAKKIGFTGKIRTVDEINDSILAQLGVTREYMRENGFYIKKENYEEYRLQKGEDTEMPTPSGKIELYSSIMEEMEFDPLPPYVKHEQPPEGELRLLFGRESHHTHARTQNNRWLLALNDFKVTAWIPEGEATRKGIKTGDKVIITKGDMRSKPMDAYVSNRIHEKAIYIPHGYGRFSKFMEAAYAMGGASDANFCSNGVDPITGAAAFMLAFVKVEKA